MPLHRIYADDIRDATFVKIVYTIKTIFVKNLFSSLEHNQHGGLDYCVLGYDN